MKHLLLAGLLAAVTLFPSAAAEPFPWELTDHVLTIRGTGELPRGTWEAHADEIYEIRLEEGITSIQANALSGLDNLQTLTLPESFTTLAPHALEGDTALARIQGLEHVTGFGYRCLSGTALMEQTPFVLTEGRLYYAEGTDLTIPDGVTELMPYAFGNLTDPQFLQTNVRVTLPDSVTVIGDNAFAFCTSLTEIDLPEHLESIGAHAFYHCARLQSLTLPESVRNIGRQAFFNCRSLETLTILNPDAVLADDSYGICYDWEQAIHSRRSCYPNETAYQQALTALREAPYSMDDAMTRFALQSHSYADLGYADDLSAAYLMHTGTLCAYAGTPVQTYAEHAAIDFIPLPVLSGDVNSDGTVNILDVMLLNKYLLGTADLSAPARAAADMDADGSLTSADSLAILKLILQ